MAILRRFSRTGPARDSVCWLLMLSLVVPAALVEQARAQCAGEDPPGGAGRAPKELSADDLKRVAEKLAPHFEALEDAAKEIPRDTFDPDAVISSTGKDAARIFEWVRDNTYLVPYKGVLRDYQGVLMDRRGNSVDRALLLYVLLTKAGHEARLAHAELTEKEAVQLLETVRPASGRGVAPPEGSAAIDKIVDEISERHGVDSAKLRTVSAEMTVKRQRLAEDLARRVGEQAPALAGILESRNLAAQQSPEQEQSAARATAMTALRDHWWVQLNAAGEWSDLDPSLPTAAPGQCVSKATQTVAKGQIDETLRSLGLAHEIVIRVVIERWNGGKLEQAPVLEQKLLPCFLVGKRVALHHVPMNWPQDVDWFAEEDPVGRLKAVALAETEWLPTLTVDSERVAQNAFTDRGEITKPKALPSWVHTVLRAQKFAEGFQAAAEALGGGVGGMLSGGRIGSAGAHRGEPPEPLVPRAAGPTSVLTAEWIEYETRVPGGTARRVRRDIFDILGPAARAAHDYATAPALTDQQRVDRGLALIDETEMLLLVCQLSPEAVSAWTAANVLAGRDPLMALLHGEGGLTSSSILERAGKIAPVPSRLFDLALVRGGLVRDAGTYLASPNILSYRRFPHVDATGMVAVCHGYDIVINDVAVSPGSTGSHFRARLAQGVMDTNAEFVLARAAGLAHGVAEFFGDGSSGAGEWSAWRKGDSGFETLDLPRDARARIDLDLDAGYVVVMPKKRVVVQGRPQVMWWSIDPTTGGTIGIEQHGWGGAAAESMLMHARCAAALILMVFCILPYAREFRRDVEAGRAPPRYSGPGPVLCFVSASLAVVGIGIGGFAGGVFGLASAVVAIMNQVVRQLL